MKGEGGSDCLDFFFFRFYTFHQFELACGSGQVMVFALCFKVDVFFQVVGQESQAQFEGYEPD